VIERLNENGLLLGAPVVVPKTARAPIKMSQLEH
jgi:hypothetical protein